MESWSGVDSHAVEMSAVCRACLGAEAAVSLFAGPEGEELAARLAAVARLVVQRADRLPQRLCGGCAAALAAATRFAARANAADRALRHILATFPHKSLQDATYYDIHSVYKVDTFTADAKPDSTHETEENISEIKQEPSDDYDGDFLLENSHSEPTPPKKPRKKKMKREKMGPIQCVVCGLMTGCRSAMETHMRTHTGEKPFACDSCSLRFPTKGALKRHTATNHSQRERRFTCETCGNSFYTKSDIVTHMRIHTNEKPYVCPFCSKPFRQIASLIRHKRVHTGEKPYPCPVCGKTFRDKNLVNKHLHVHSEERKFTCHLCNKAVKTKTALNTHMSLHSNEKRNICSFCGMAFAMKGNLQTHVRRMHSERSGQCAVCLKAVADVAAHMRAHTGERPFACAACPAAFASQRARAHHAALKHAAAGRFSCAHEGCGRAFPTGAMLRFHELKAHEARPPLACAVCARPFYRASDLSRHMRSAHAQPRLQRAVPKLQNLPLKSLDCLDSLAPT